MVTSHVGEFAALLTAVFWTITAISFEYAGKKIGSLSVNLLRLYIAFFFLCGYSLVTRGMLFPMDASKHQWIWLSLSGLIGFVLGDLLIFKAFIMIGARTSILIMSLAPPIAATFGWVLMNESLGNKNIIGMSLTFIGIMMVILGKEKNTSEGDGNNVKKKKLRFSYSLTGILLALGGTIGESAGLVFGKYGMSGYDAFSATQIRVLIGLIGFSILFLISSSWGKISIALKNKSAMTGVSVGAFFGPFLGVAFSLIAVKYTSTGKASTIMSLVPILIIPATILFLKEKPGFKEIAGALVAVSGVALFFL